MTYNQKRAFESLTKGSNNTILKNVLKIKWENECHIFFLGHHCNTLISFVFYLVGLARAWARFSYRYFWQHQQYRYVRFIWDRYVVMSKLTSNISLKQRKILHPRCAFRTLSTIYDGVLNFNRFTPGVQ